MSEKKKFVAAFDEDIALEDGGLELVDDGALEEIVICGGNAGDWIRLGHYAYMVVVPVTTVNCEYFSKGPNKYKGVVTSGTCSCCTRMFSKNGYWLCAKSKTELPS